MILVDSSVWIDHLRRPQPDLATLLLAGRVMCHPFVIGELACGYLRQRATMLAELAHLPQAPVASQDEALAFVERHALAGRGIGWADVHLLASATLAAGRLWTRDRRLAEAAARQDVGYPAALH